MSHSSKDSKNKLKKPQVLMRLYVHYIISILHPRSEEGRHYCPYVTDEKMETERGY